MEKQLRRTSLQMCCVDVSVGRFTQFSLSKPSVRDSYFVVGSDDPHGDDRKDHHIMCLSLAAVQDQQECLVSSIPLNEVNAASTNC